MILRPETLRATPPNCTISQAPDSLNSVVSSPHFRIDTLSVKIFFHVGKSNIDLNFCENGKRLNEFITNVREAVDDSTHHVTAHQIIGYASPEGPYKLNQRLSTERANHIASYLQRHYSLNDTLLTVSYGGINWDGLSSAIETSPLKNANYVQEIITSSPELSRNQQLKKLDEGRTWRWMLNNVFPQLRYSSSVICYVKSRSPKVEAINGEFLSFAEYKPNDLPLREVQVPEYKFLTYPVVALRSNLLLPGLNVGVEVPVAKHWSVGMDYYYPWIWPNKHNKNCFELLTLSAEARYWFDASSGYYFPERNHLTGHSVGVYGTWGYYDFERNYHGYQGDVMSAGIDYLYAMPIADGRMRLEFEAALGAVWSNQAQPYNVYVDGGRLIREKNHYKNFSYFGPSRVAVSLVIPIYHKFKVSKSPAAQ